MELWKGRTRVFHASVQVPDCNEVSLSHGPFERDIILPAILSELGYEKKEEGKLATIFAQLR